MLLDFLDERFGIGQTALEDFDILAFSRQAFLFRAQGQQMTWPEKAFVRCGLPFLRNVAGYLKPTTVFIQRFGYLATKNVLELNMAELTRLCHQGEILFPAPSNSTDSGYVIIKMQNHFLGAGLLLDGSRLLCRFPKAMREAISRLNPE